MGEQRRQGLQFVEQREAHRADRAPVVVLDRQAGDDHRVTVCLEDVQQDGLACGHHLAHQAVGNHLLAVAADGLLRVGEPEARRVALVDPDHARVVVHHECAFAEILERAEQRGHGATRHVVVVQQQGTARLRYFLHAADLVVSMGRRRVSHKRDLHASIARGNLQIETNTPVSEVLDAYGVWHTSCKLLPPPMPDKPGAIRARRLFHGRSAASVQEQILETSCLLSW
ncbi:hypothetical protein D3C85_1190470 [compost metagenome]